jgi:hypothetical protein
MICIKKVFSHGNGKETRVKTSEAATLIPYCNTSTTLDLTIVTPDSSL